MFIYMFKQDMAANGSALLCYAMISSVQKLTEVIKSNSRILKNTETGKYRKILNRILKRPLKQNGVDEKRFPD